MLLLDGKLCCNWSSEKRNETSAFSGGKGMPGNNVSSAASICGAEPRPRTAMAFISASISPSTITTCRRFGRLRLHLSRFFHFPKKDSDTPSFNQSTTGRCPTRSKSSIASLFLLKRIFFHPVAYSLAQFLFSDLEKLIRSPLPYRSFNCLGH